MMNVTWRCQRASEIWRTSNLFQGSMVHHFGSFMDILWYMVMIAQWDRSSVENLIVIAWALWSNWNECRNGGAKKSCQALLQGALEYLSEYQACMEVKVSPLGVSMGRAGSSLCPTRTRPECGG